MTERNDDRKSRDEALEALVADALSSRGELLPTTDAEVARAEDDGVEFEGELPQSLQAFTNSRHDPIEAPPQSTDNVVDLGAARTRRRGPSSWLGYASAGLVGAAAASIFWVWFGNEPQDIAPMPAGDPSSSDATSSAPTPPVAVPPVRECPSPCCAGPSCASAEEPLKQCSSGRACIPCSLDHLQGSLYRLRIGSLALSPTGQQLREKQGWSLLELCVRVGSSDSTCVPAHAGTTGDEVWTSLPLAISALDLTAGFELEVRRKGSRDTLASWKHAVLTNPTLLCRGLSVSPKLSGGENIGTLSVFFEDAHFVELARRGNVPDLLGQARTIAFADVTPTIFETTEQGDRRFALVAGPLDKPSAERLRWKLLDANIDARISVGSDHVGQPRAVDR